MENISNDIKDIKLSKSKHKKPVINNDKELPTSNKPIYNLEYINTRINTEICNETIIKLKDELCRHQASIVKDNKTGRRFIMPSKLTLNQKKIYKAFGLPIENNTKLLEN